MALTFFAFSILPIAYIHELGHALICNLQGGHAKIGRLSDDGITSLCLSSQGDVRQVRFFGGFAAAMATLSPLIVHRRLKENRIYRAVLVALLPQSIAEVPKAILEPLAYSFYSTTLAGNIFFVLVLFLTPTMFLILGKVRPQKLMME